MYASGRFLYSSACSGVASNTVNVISVSMLVIFVCVSSCCNVFSYWGILLCLCIPLNNACVSSGLVFNMSIMLVSFFLLSIFSSG